MQSKIFLKILYEIFSRLEPTKIIFAKSKKIPHIKQNKTKKDSVFKKNKKMSFLGKDYC